MESHQKKIGNGKVGWKKKLLGEIREYLVNAAYLAIFFGVFTWYGRLILAQYQIDYLDYGTGLVEALILAKIIMIGDIMQLGKRLDGKPLILATLYKSLIFTIFVGLFTVLEYALRGLFGGKGIIGGILELIATKTGTEVLARNLVVFCAFIPFFAFKELGRVLGEEKISRLFFRGTST